jgi:hypothetical protein
MSGIIKNRALGQVKGKRPAEQGVFLLKEER